MFQDRTLYINNPTGCFLFFQSVWDINKDGEFYFRKASALIFSVTKQASCLLRDKNTFCDLCVSLLSPFSECWQRHTNTHASFMHPRPLIPYSV